MTQKSVLAIQEDEIIMVNSLPCRVIHIDVSPSGKTAKVIFNVNGIADSMRVGVNTFLEVLDSDESNYVEDEPEPEVSNVIMFAKHKPNKNDISAELQEYRNIIAAEYKEVHDFYLKNILSMPAIVKRAIELAMGEMKMAKFHLEEKHQKEIGAPMPRI